MCPATVFRVAPSPRPLVGPHRFKGCARYLDLPAEGPLRHAIFEVAKCSSQKRSTWRQITLRGDVLSGHRRLIWTDGHAIVTTLFSTAFIVFHVTFRLRCLQVRSAKLLSLRTHPPFGLPAFVRRSRTRLPPTIQIYSPKLAYEAQERLSTIRIDRVLGRRKCRPSVKCSHSDRLVLHLWIRTVLEVVLVRYEGFSSHAWCHTARNTMSLRRSLPPRTRSNSLGILR